MMKYYLANIPQPSQAQAQPQLTTHQVGLTVREGDNSALLHQIVAQLVVVVAGARPEGERVGGGLVLAGPLHLAQLGHQAASLLGETQQVQPQGVRGVEDGLETANQVVDVLQDGNVLPPVTPPQEAGAGGEEGEATDCSPSLRILAVHPHSDLPAHYLFHSTFNAEVEILL